MNQDVGSLDHAEAATGRADVYGFLATMLNERPDMAFVHNLRSAGGKFIRALAREASLQGEAALGFREMARFVEESEDRAESAVEQDLAVDWTKLFRGVSPAFGPVPPYEASFISSERSEVELIQEVNDFYHANGLEINSDYNNRPDYLGLEFSFLAHLAEAETRALAEGCTAEAQSAHDAARRFLVEHLVLWADKYIANAMGYAETGFYRGFLRLCRAIVTEAVD